MPQLDDTLLGGFLIGVIPAAVIALWFWLQYPKGREPIHRVLLVVFLAGFLFPLPMAPIQLALSAVFGGGALGTAFVAAGLLEELTKFLAIRAFAWRHPAFRCVQDGLYFGVLAGTGFGLCEDFLYMAGGGTDIGLLRLLAPFHPVWTGIMGYYLGLARFARDPRQARRWTAQGLAIAVVLHGAWDAICFTGREGRLGPLMGAPLMLGVWLTSLYLLQRRLVIARRVDAARRERPRGTGRLVG